MRTYQSRPQNARRKPPTSSKIWLYGKHAVYAALANPARQCFVLRIDERNKSLSDDPELRSLIKNKPSLIIEKVAAAALAPLVPKDAPHQGIILQVAPLETPSLDQLLREHAHSNAPLYFILLDQVLDPHNVGAVLRSAAAFDALAVITTTAHAPHENGTLAKTASGGLEVVPFIHVSNLAQTIALLKKYNFWCVGLDGEAEITLGDYLPVQRAAFIFGAEGKGLRRNTRAHCDTLVKLPMGHKMESLNVSNAVAITAYHFSLHGTKL